MKYASNMPIRSYETTIGSFDMVDLSSYYVVDDSIFESDNITIDNSETLSDDPNVNYWGVVKGKTEYTTYKNVSSNYPLAINIGTIKQEVSVVDTIDYLTADKQPYVSVKSEYPLLKKGPPSVPSAYEPVGTGGTEITINTELDDRIPTIKAYIPSTVKNNAFIRVVQNYEV